MSMLPKEERAALLYSQESLQQRGHARRAIEFLSHYLVHPFPEYLTGAQKQLNLAMETHANTEVHTAGRRQDSRAV